jgi:hypothetical protein
MVELRRTRLYSDSESTHIHARICIPVTVALSISNVIGVHFRVRITQGSPVNGAATQDLPRRKVQLSPPVADIIWNFPPTDGDHEALRSCALLKQHTVKSDVFLKVGGSTIEERDNGYHRHLSLALILLCFRAGLGVPVLVICARIQLPNRIFLYDRPPSVYCYRKGHPVSGTFSC